ncbi:putative ribonuclease H-like domain-containing protein [Tanacetum coccineum]
MYQNRYEPEVMKKYQTAWNLYSPLLFKSESSKLTSTLTVETAVPTVSTHVPTASENIFTIDPSEPPSTPTMERFIEIQLHVSTRLNEVEADLSNMEFTIQVSPTPTLRIHKDHPKNQIIGPVDTPVLTRHKSTNVDAQSFLATIHQKTNPDLLQLCLFSAFLSQEEPKKISEALKDSSWVEAMQEELLQFQIQNVWVLVDCPKGVRPIGTKLVLKNKKDERGIVIRNKARLVAQGHTQEEVYQMDVKSVFLYGTIDEEVLFKERIEALNSMTNQMRLRVTLSFFLGLQVLQKKDGIFLSQDKYVGDILKKFGFSDLRSMIGSLMYLTASRPDIMFVVCACARHQVTPKECHLHAVKRIFRYLKGHPKLGLWYPKESPFDLVAYSDSDYGGASQDRKSTTRGCQFLGRRLISWQCKKQTIVATSTTEAETLIMTKLAFCDYHNMVAILENTEHNTDFHQIVDFLQASHIRIKTADGETNILAKINGKQRTISESSIRRHLKLNDEEGISTLPDNELFEHLSLMDETAPPTRGDRYGEAFPTATSLDAGSRSTDKGSESTRDLANVLSSMGAANILASGDPTTEVLTTARDTTPYTRRPRASRGVVIRSTSPIPISIPSARKEDKRKGKEIMTEPEKPAKAKVQEQMSLQLARELQEEFVHEDQSIREQIERDAEIARIHAEEDLRQMINELDRSNVMINKHMAEYEEAENDLTIEEKTELITELINYQKDFASIKKYQAQQQRLASKSERRKFYTSVLRSHARWKTKDFRGMTFDQLEEKSGILLEKVKEKRLKTSDVSAQEQQESDNQDEIINLQQWDMLVREETSENITSSVVKVPIYDWKIYKDKLREVYQIFRVGQAPKVMFEPVATDLLWQFEAPIKSWKMYKSCKVHCLSMEGMIIYMLDDVEYPFQKTTLKKMLDHKCEVSEFNEDVIQMINLIRGQLKKE